MMRRNGFTLLELMLAMAILAGITAGLWRMTKGGTLSFVRAQRQAAVINSGDLALRGSGSSNGILKDIRRCSEATAIQADRLSLKGPGGTLEYLRQGNTLVRAVAGSTVTAAGNVTALSFRYFKAHNGLLSAATAAALVDSVEVSVSMSRGDVAYNLVSSAKLRNK